jgi:hypothetical protein
VSWFLAAALTLSPTVSIVSWTPDAFSCLATSHGAGGAQESSPSETRTIEPVLPLGRAAAACCSDDPIGVSPLAANRSTAAVRPGLSTGATGAIISMSWQAFAWSGWEGTRCP